MKPEERLAYLLSKNGYKLTSVRTEIYRLFLEADRPLSNSEMVKLADAVDKVSVYRTITLFENIGIIHRIWNGFKSKVELTEEFSPHHHHFTCMVCGKVSSFDDEDLEKSLKKIQAQLGVRVKNHLIELSGTCSACESLTSK